MGTIPQPIAKTNQNSKQQNGILQWQAGGCTAMSEEIERYQKLIQFRDRIKTSSIKDAGQPKIFDGIERWAKVVQNFTIIFGVFIGTISLFNAQLDRRVARTIEVDKQYHAETRDDFIDLTTKWNSYASGIAGFFQKLPDEQSDIVVKFFDDDTKQKSLNEILDFYDVLFVCIDKRSCDRNSALELFGKNADDTYEDFAFYILAQRKAQRDTSIGDGLEKIYKMAPESFFWRYL